MNRTVVVLAGGLGTRVAHLTGDLPKALLPIDGRPFIDLKLAELVASGASEIVLLVGHGADAIQDHVGDHVGSRTFGDVPVRFVEDGPVLLGTGGALRQALASLPERFWVTYGDTLLEVPLEAVERWSETSALSCVMTVLCNEDRWETSNVSIDEQSRVTAYEKPARTGTYRYIDYGMSFLSAAAFAARPAETPFDLGDVLGELVAGRALGAWVVEERFHDIGTEAAWQETDAWARETSLDARLQQRIERR